MTIITALTPFEWLQRELCKKHLLAHTKAARHIACHPYDKPGGAA